MAAPVETGGQALGAPFSSGTPVILFQAQYYSGSGAFLGRTYDVSPDGRHFLMIKESSGAADQTATPTQIVVVQNWVEELKRLVPTK